MNLYKPVDYASLAVMRILFGFILCWEVCRYFNYHWIARYYINPSFHFSYFGFSWVHPWPGNGMYWHFLLVGVLAFLILTGLFYRIASILFVFAFSYIFLLEKARYLNHFYMVILISILLAIVPANRNWSLDAIVFKKSRGDSIPLWSIWIFRLQMEIIYLYAGIVKINGDWLRGQPLTMWLHQVANYPVLGSMVSIPHVPLIAGYGVILLHLIGPILLLFRRTRLYIFIVYACFHLLNAWMFRIGIFPWLTLGSTLIFFDPDWPRQVWHKLKNGFQKTIPYHPKQYQNATQISSATKTTLCVGLTIWFTFQVVFPLRHLLYPGNVSWNEQGHTFSWQMKLRDKRSRACQFTVVDQTHHQKMQIDLTAYLTREQIYKMCTRPDMILQFAHYLKKIYQAKTQGNIAVYAQSMVSLDGRPYTPMIDPHKNLAAEKRVLWPPADFILPLKVPLYAKQ